MDSKQTTLVILLLQILVTTFYYFEYELTYGQAVYWFVLSLANTIGFGLAMALCFRSVR